MAAWMCLRGRVSEKKNLAERHFDTTAAVFQISNTLTYAKQLNGKMCSSCFILYSAKNMSQSKRKLVTKNILRYYSNLARVPIHNMVLCKTLLSRCINHTFEIFCVMSYITTSNCFTKYLPVIYTINRFWDIWQKTWQLFLFLMIWKNITALN